MVAEAAAEARDVTHLEPPVLPLNGGSLGLTRVRDATSRALRYVFSKILNSTNKYFYGTVSTNGDVRSVRPGQGVGWET